MSTSRDVARLAGVSQSTVSYVLTGKRPISEETRRRVEEAMVELTFHPNAGARALASQRTRVVGLMAPFGASTHQQGLLPFVETIASGVREHDHDLLLVTSDEGAEGMARVVGRRIVDALVVMEVGARDERLAVAAALGVPVIVIGVPDEPGELPCVDLDFALGAALAVDELVAVGCTAVAVLGYSAVTTDRDLNYVRRFLGGAERRAAEVGVPLRVVAPVEVGRASVAAALDQALDVPAGAAGTGRVGVLVPNTEALPEVLRALRARGLEAGADVPLVGVCTDAEAAASEPALTNVSLEPRDVSRRAVEALFQLLDPEPDLVRGGPAAVPALGSAVQLVPPRVTRRETTRLAGSLPT